MTTTEVVPAQVEAAIAETGSGFTPAQVALIRSMFARGATDDELAVYLRIAAKYELDPLARQIWLICELDEKGNRKLGRDGQPRPPQLQPSRDGWRVIAQRNPLSDGIQAAAVYSGDEYDAKPTEGVVHHRAVFTAKGTRDGKLSGAWALVWRKDWRHPAFAFASWQEYGLPMTRKDGDPNGDLINAWSPWRKYPSAMIEKVAETNALKRAFPLSGLSSYGVAILPGEDDAPEDEPEGAPSDAETVPVTPRADSDEGVGAPGGVEPSPGGPPDPPEEVPGQEKLI